MTGPVITFEEGLLRFTEAGKTYVLKGSAAEILKRHRAIYSEPHEAGAFWKGVLVTLTLVEQMAKEKELHGEAEKKRIEQGPQGQGREAGPN